MWSGFDKIMYKLCRVDFMKTRILVTLLVLIPGVSFAVARSDNARVGVQRVSIAGARSPNISANISSSAGGKVNPTMTVKGASAGVDDVEVEEEIVEDVAEEDVATQA